jgi:LmbE family N-acetylglucosaminyl deacetylase
MARGRLLISYAHPDDESFGLGGLIGKYVAQGYEVYLICATNGDVGTVKPEFLEGFESIAARRLYELDKAAQILRLKRVFTLGYRDSGMMGSETTNDPACLWQAPREQVAARVAAILREVRPHVVITFNKYGGYGHPDHIAIQRATTDAIALAADPAFENALPPWQVQKLYYSSIPKRQIQLGIMLLRLRRQDPRRMGRNKDIDVKAIVDNAEPIHALVDISGFYDIWERASAVHESQLGGRSTPRLPMRVRARLFGRQGFTRIIPAPKANRVDEYDLFQNVVFEDESRPAPQPAKTPAALR